MADQNTIKQLKDKIYNSYGIILKEDDPAWLMIVIYNDLLGNVNQSISDLKNLPEISTQNQSMLTALTELQSKTADLFVTADSITAKTATENSKLLAAVKEEVANVKSAINKSVSDAVKGIDIDTSNIEKAIEKKISIVDLEELNKFITETNESVDTVKEEMTNDMDQIKEIKEAWEDSVSSLENIPQQINDATYTLNKKIASLGWGRFFAGLIIGTTLSGSIIYVNSHTIYNAMFEKQEQERLKGLKSETQILFDKSTSLDKKYAEKADMIKELNKYGIEIHNEKGKKYISVKTHYGERGIMYNYSNKYSFIQIDGKSK